MTKVVAISAPRVYCRESGVDGPAKIDIRDGRIQSLTTLAEAPDAVLVETPEGTLTATNAVVVPGLVDLHIHVGGAGFGREIDADRDILASGTTTAASQGDAGAYDIDSWIAETTAGSRLRVLLAIYIGVLGDTDARAPLHDESLLDEKATLSAIRKHPELVWGIAVNTSRRSLGTLDPRSVLLVALRIASETGLPLLYGPRQPEDWSLTDQFALLRPGDVVTYCFRKQPYSLLTETGSIRPEVDRARAAGVLFDVGAGITAFDKTVARQCIEMGWYPDTISSDIQVAYKQAGVRHDVASTAAQLVALGLPEHKAIDAITTRPAAALRLIDGTGTLRPGAAADITVLSDDDLWEPHLVLRAGEISHSLPSAGRWRRGDGASEAARFRHSMQSL